MYFVNNRELFLSQNPLWFLFETSASLFYNSKITLLKIVEYITGFKIISGTTILDFTITIKETIIVRLRYNLNKQKMLYSTIQKKKEKIIMNVLPLKLIF